MVVVADGETVVIGGLIGEDYQDTVSKVPWLGDIPFLGWAFKSTSRTLTKRNLLVFLTPHIVRTAEDLRRIKEQIGEHHQQFKREQEIEGSNVDPTKPVVLEPAPVTPGSPGRTPAQRP